MTDLPDWSDEHNHLFSFEAQNIIDAKKAVKVGDEAKDMFKEKMPDKCRRMDFNIGGNLDGHKIRVTRSRAGTLTCTHIAPKEKNDE
jgi:hypothetical protein